LADYFATRGVKVGSVGPGTTRALASYGVSATVEATKFEAEGLASAVANASRELVGARVLSFRGNRGRDALRAIFETFGAQYCEVEAYRTVDVERAYPDVLSELAAGRVDAAVATSSASAQSLAKMFGDLGSRTRWAALSPRTAEALRATGLEVAAIADEATMDSLVDAVVGLFER
ncbi:MAG: uroporphyrinogen-III synthase, partial [Thermoguttaceae bacterium]|nr:uroporphyrinogen-III synthase [Thermoguttaceae bacterium]